MASYWPQITKYPLCGQCTQGLKFSVAAAPETSLLNDYDVPQADTCMYSDEEPITEVRPGVESPDSLF